MSKDSRNSFSISQLPQSTGAVPGWVVAMREAAQNEISADDIAEIVKNQVKRAKEGDDKAIKFVFDQILGGASFKGATFNQTVHQYGQGSLPGEASEGMRGTEDRIEAMAARAARGESVFDDNDFEPDLD